MNVLKPHLQITATTLLAAGKSQREIERITRVDRKTHSQPGAAVCGRSSKFPRGGHRLGQSNSPTPATGNSGRFAFGVRASPRIQGDSYYPFAEVM